MPHQQSAEQSHFVLLPFLALRMLRFWTAAVSPLPPSLYSRRASAAASGEKFMARAVESVQYRAGQKLILRTLLNLRGLYYRRTGTVITPWFNLEWKIRTQHCVQYGWGFENDDFWTKYQHKTSKVGQLRKGISNGRWTFEMRLFFKAVVRGAVDSWRVMIEIWIKSRFSDIVFN